MIYIYIPVITNCTQKASWTDSSSLLLLGDGYDARLQEVVSLKTPLLMNISIKSKVCINPYIPSPHSKEEKRKKEKKRKHLH